MNTRLVTTNSKLSRRAIQYAIAAACLAVGVWLMAGTERRESPEAHARRLEKEHGVVLGFGDPSTFFVEPYKEAIPSSDAYRPQPAERDAAAIALKAVEESLRQYPSGFVAKLIRAIFICGELRMDGAEAGGTVGPTWIILAAPRKLGVEGIQLTSRIGVHHELSSIVYHQRAAIDAEWRAFAPGDSKFTTRADEALDRFTDVAPALGTGFLSAYGATTPENDFNTYAEKMFTEPVWVANAAKGEPLVAKKLAYVMTAYQKIDSRMHEVFEELGL